VSYTPPNGALVAFAFDSPADPHDGAMLIGVFSEAVAAAAQNVLPTAIDSLQFGSVAIAHLLDIAGIDSLQFGATTVVNVAQGIAPDGIQALFFGATVVTKQHREVYPVGFSASIFGTTSVELFNRPIYPVALDGVAFGAHTVRHYGAVDVAPGTDWLSFGLPFVSHLHRPITPTGWDSARVFVSGLPTPPGEVRPGVAFPPLTLRPGDYDHLEFGNPTVWFLDRPLSATGYDTAEFGVPRTEHLVRSIDAPGFDSYEPGTAFIAFKIRGVEPSGWDSAALGAASASPSINPAGIAPLEFGEPIVSLEYACNRWQIAYPTIGDTSQFGTAGVTN